MQDKLKWTEEMFDLFFDAMHYEVTKAKQVIDHMAGETRQGASSASLSYSAKVIHVSLLFFSCAFPGNRSVFSVSLSNSSGLICYGNFSEEKRIKYTHTFINPNNHYDEQTGIFTVPYKGTYSISVTIYIEGSGHRKVCGSLQVNGKEVAKVIDDKTQDKEDSSTVVLTMELDAEDQVSVNLPIGCNICYDQNHYNTFTGFLLYSH